MWQRGNNKDYIFQDSTTKGFFVNQLKEYNKKFDYNILAYVIMSKHYHLLIQNFKDPTGEIMFNTNNVTRKFIRHNLHRIGHVFQGKYTLSEIAAYLNTTQPAISGLLYGHK